MIPVVSQHVLWRNEKNINTSHMKMMPYQMESEWFGSDVGSDVHLVFVCYFFLIPVYLYSGLPLNVKKI